MRDPKHKERQANGHRVKVRREVVGLRGKAVTAVPMHRPDDAGLRQLAGRLKEALQWAARSRMV